MAPKPTFVQSFFFRGQNCNRAIAADTTVSEPPSPYVSMGGINKMDNILTDKSYTGYRPVDEHIYSSPRHYPSLSPFRRELSEERDLNKETRRLKSYAKAKH